MHRETRSETGRLTHDDVDEPLGHDDDLDDVLAVDVGLDLGHREAQRLELLRAALGRASTRSRTLPLTCTRRGIRARGSADRRRPRLLPDTLTAEPLERVGGGVKGEREQQRRRGGQREAQRAGDGSPSRAARRSSSVSSMIAAIAVLKAKRPAMSLVTFSMAECALRSSSRSEAESSSGTGWSGVCSAASALDRRQPPEEAVHALDARVRPVGILVGRADEHHVGAQRVGLVALDVALGRDHVAARLAHLAPRG